MKNYEIDDQDDNFDYKSKKRIISSEYLSIFDVDEWDHEKG